MERAGFMTCTAASPQGAIKEPTASLLRMSETHPVSSMKALRKKVRKKKKVAKLQNHRK